MLVFLLACTQQVVQEDATAGLIKEGGYQGRLLAGDTAPYLEFAQADYEKALDDGKVILLYFYANWCPVCRKEQPEVIAAFDELELDSVVGFRVNYDDDETNEFEKQLAREHGVSYQHTKVIIKNGDRVLKAPDSWDQQRYIEEIRKVV